MEMLSFLELHNQMAPNSIALTFKGNVTFELIDSIIGIISSKLDHIEDNVTVRKRVYGVLTECLQNLCTHIETEENKKHTHAKYDINMAIIMVDSDEDGYVIKTGNFIPNERVEPLDNWLKEINSQDISGLKELYNKILTNKVFSSKGGGGLGFVDIAKKSGKKLTYNFEPVDNKYSFFSFLIKINKSNQ